MKTKRLVIIISLCVLLLITFSILLTFAFWKVQKTQSGNNDILGACLNIELAEEMSGFTLENAWPITDQEGSNLNGYSFTVENRCKEAVTYQVILDSLETKHPSRAMNPKYIKVQLDNNVIRRYSALANAEEINPSALASKKVFTGTIPGRTNGTNGIVSHTIKLWISYDSPGTEAKTEFSSKIRVVAGQQIIPDSRSTLKILSKEGNPDATINNIQQGDIVAIDSEKFYVIGVDGYNVSLLSMWLLNTGPNAKPGATEGLQDWKIGYSRKFISDKYSCTPYMSDNTRGALDGAIRFSENRYWWDLSNQRYQSPYEANSFIYNDQSYIKPYIDEYVQLLRNKGLNVTEGTLLSIQKVEELCDADFTSSLTIPSSSYANCPDYIFATMYWLGSTYYGDTIYKVGSIWTVNVAGYVSAINYNGDVPDYNVEMFGIRPVVNISLD